MNIRGVVFDMDGVLLDTESICDKAWALAAEEFGLERSLSEKAITLCRGKNKADSLTTLKGVFGENVDVQAFLGKSSENFHKIEDTCGIELMPNVLTILEYLKNKNVPMAVASSTRNESVMRQLKNAGIIHYFSPIITGDMVEHSKPDPEIYLKACEKLGLNPKNCLAIEDSPNGLKSARKAGLKTVMVPDLIPYTDELKEYVDYLYDDIGKVSELF